MLVILSGFSADLEYLPSFQNPFPPLFSGQTPLESECNQGTHPAGIKSNTSVTEWTQVTPMDWSEGSTADTADHHGTSKRALQQTLVAAMVWDEGPSSRHQWLPWCEMKGPAADTGGCHGVRWRAQQQTPVTVMVQEKGSAAADIGDHYDSVVLWTRFIWLRTGTSDGFLWTW
jgi:hypothetical protein